MCNPIFISIAGLISGQSKCMSHKVGAVIVKDDRIISTGYNGTAPGLTNCNQLFSKSLEGHREWSKLNEIHAEMNAIIYAAKNGLSIDGADIYITLSPCNECLKNITASGIKNVYYLEEHKTDFNLELLKNIKISQIKS